MTQDIDPNSIAIVGLAGRFPSARTPDELWTLLREGKEATRWATDAELRAAGVPEAELRDPNYVRAVLELPDMEMFDAEFFGFSKRDAAVLDPQHRHFLECAWEALEDAGHVPEKFDGAIGVFGGCGMQAYLPYNLLSNPELVQSMGLFLLRHTGNDKDFLCSRVSYLLDLQGPSVSVQTACSTSLVAVHMGAQSLLSGECDMALAGGVSIELPHRQGYRYAEGEILSPDGHCRAFDDASAGTLFGSGAAIVVLRRLEDAVRDGDHIYAVIRGSAVNNDGSRKAGYLAPSVDGQARAAAEALAVAGVPPGSVQYVEAHGTGTPVGDPIEVAALAQAYGEGGQGFCGIGSLKTNIGHLDTAAGAASLIKVAMAMRHGLIPATLNFTQPNRHMEIGSTPFQVVDRPRPWPRGGAPRRAAVNSLGVGGTNAHVIVEEPPLRQTESNVGPHAVLLSARSAASLARLKEKWSGFLANPPPEFDLGAAAFTTQAGRRAFGHRCAVTASDVPSLQHALRARASPMTFSGEATEKEPRAVWMFPGGGAHYPGAGRTLLARPAFREAVDACFTRLPPDAPADLRRVMFECGPDDTHAVQLLQRPSYALPALFILEYALAQLWQTWGVRPAAVIGHSAGEYAAACIAGIMDVADALALVVLRGQLFESAPAGGMLSVDLPEADLAAKMRGLPLDIAAVNAPDLSVASGPADAVAQLAARLTAEGIESRRVHIDVAAHSRQLDGILPRFRERLSRMRFRAPTLPFISNLTGDWADAQQIATADYWVRHLREPVRFADGLARLNEWPDAVLLEIGPGQGLCALARQNIGTPQRLVLPSTGKAHDPSADLALMTAAAGALWTRGVRVDWAAVRGTASGRRIPLPTYAFDHQRHWIEPGIRPVEASVAQPAPAEPQALLHRLPGMDDWFRVPEWVRAGQAAPSGGTSGDWLVFGNRSQLTADVVAQAKAGGAKVTLVRRGADFQHDRNGNFVVAPADAEHYTRLLQTLEQQAAMPRRIVHLWALDTLPGSGAAQVSDQTLAFDSLMRIAQSIQTLDVASPIRLTVVTAGAQAVRPEELPHPERALALGPCRVIPRELPNVTARMIDLGPSDTAAGQAAATIVREALLEGEDDLVAYRDGERWVQRLVAAPRPGDTAKPLLREGGTYLITGGLGDIALDLAAFMASQHKARLALVSRRALPPKANWPGLAASGDHSAEVRMVRRLLAIEDQGGQVIAFSADVADRGAMARVIGQCRARFGAIHGVFHAAGLLEDAPIAAKGSDSVQRVLDAKAGGAQVLHELLPPGDLDLFAVFSSTSVYLGAEGQVDYVAANAFLDALAASRRDGLSIHWGVWGDKGMAARAYGGASPDHAPAAGTNPLLGTQVDSDDGAAFEALYAPRDLWVLREHMVAGRPVLPGTAYVEIAHAAMMALHPQAAIEIRSLSFGEAMVFDALAPRMVRTELRRGANGYDFTVRSRGARDADWQEHARAGVSVFLGTLPASAPSPGGTWREGAIPQEKAVAFGERWHNIQRFQTAGRGATAEIELPAQFAADLATYAIHPAMTDMAATFGLHLVDAAEREGCVFVPMSVARIRIAGRVPARMVSRVELKNGPHSRFAAFDVALHTPDGAPIATFEGFSLRGVAPAAVSPQSGVSRAPALAETLLACGIQGKDAPELFQRIFSGAARDIVVSSIELQEIRRVMAQAAPHSPARKPGSAVAGAEMNAVERVIADAWRELLGVEEIAADDDFFALGGHSLAAVRLFARIRKNFNVDLPLATLIEAPTLASLAAMVARHAGIEVVPQDASPRSGSNVIPLGNRAWSPLVAICRGSDEIAPLFCVHGAGGNVLNFKVISDRLGAQLPFYGLQAQGVDGRLPPLSSIEEMAAQYVEAIRTVDPRGPYQLAGYSAGGVIALEMAQQLRRAGADVALLAMIDTLSPSAARRKVSYLKKLWLMRHWSLDFALEWPGRRRKGKQADARYAQALERLARGEPLPPELVEFHLFRKFIAAQERYHPEPYDGDMVLFKASQADTQYLGAGRALGWEAHVSGDIRVSEIDGSHFTMMAEPGVSQLIAGLRAELGLRGPALPPRHAGDTARMPAR
jgi:acyl transferase domain-containing protein/thioesterase domain-containing protein/acyl carrier protein